MVAYDLYAVEAASISEARHLIERLLSLSLEEHDSSFHRGSYYAAGRIGEENFALELNLDPYEDEPNESDFSAHPILFYINGTNRSSELATALSKDGRLQLLRHEEL